MMNESDIRKYAGLMQELGLTGLEITEDNKVVRLERTAPTTVKETAAVNAVVPVTPVTRENTDDIRVKSPIVGVFYAAPAENAQPYVAIGDRVKKGQTLCIVEAMKLMNEVESDVSGIVTEICVQNGESVEYGQPLIRVQK